MTLFEPTDAIGTEIETCHVPSPIGTIELIASPRGLIHLGWIECDPTLSPQSALLRQATKEIKEYFDGTRERFDVPLDLRGTDFQRSVWSALLRIEFGQLVSYSDLADQVGVINGQRAVGAANGQNPVALIVPCHRVIARSGAMQGFAYGIERKRWLIEFESRKSRLF